MQGLKPNDWMIKGVHLWMIIHQVFQSVTCWSPRYHKPLKGSLNHPTKRAGTQFHQPSLHHQLEGVPIWKEKYHHFIPLCIFVQPHGKNLCEIGNLAQTFGHLQMNHVNPTPIVLCVEVTIRWFVFSHWVVVPSSQRFVHPGRATAK